MGHHLLVDYAIDMSKLETYALLQMWLGIMFAEPQGALTYRSSTITVLDDSDPFHGLLLTDLG